MTDASGNVAARYEYGPYDQVKKTGGSLDFDFLYTGHFYHPQSGMYLAPYRAYDPKLGRWISPEPLGLDGPNLYHYVFANPAQLVDRNGLQATVNEIPATEDEKPLHNFMNCPKGIVLIPGNQCDFHFAAHGSSGGVRLADGSRPSPEQFVVMLREWGVEAVSASLALFMQRWRKGR